MDKLIKRFDARADGDLMITERGVAYQRDMNRTMIYGDAYFEKCAAKDDSPIADELNQFRVDLVNRFAGAETLVLDIGIGSGEFIRRRPNTWGADVNPKAVRWLESRELLADDMTKFSAFTMWDVIEHMKEAGHRLKRMPAKSWVFISIPIFEDLSEVRQSKHYRPDEHLYYWTVAGIIEWMALRRFEVIEYTNTETAIGRDSIATFVFRRTGPGYHETVEQYQILHEPAYGTTSALYLDDLAREVIELNPSSILDYGCGRSDLVAHFWADGDRLIAKYDPAIAEFSTLPERNAGFDLVICCDVLEHIRMDDVDRVLAEIRAQSRSALFSISLRPARRELPDGRNAHVTLLSPDEWMNWIAEVFGGAVRVPSKYDHILLVRTWGQ